MAIGDVSRNRVQYTAKFNTFVEREKVLLRGLDSSETCGTLTRHRKHRTTSKPTRNLNVDTNAAESSNVPYV